MSNTNKMNYRFDLIFFSICSNFNSNISIKVWKVDCGSPFGGSFSSVGCVRIQHNADADENECDERKAIEKPNEN